MKLEKRYIVLKLSDIKAAGLTPNESDMLEELMFKISEKRRSLGKIPLECVVVESDWPEYEPTWKAIEERATREETHRKFKTMFGDNKFFAYYYVVQNHNGEYLITSNASTPALFNSGGGYKYRLMYIGKVNNFLNLDYKDVLTTNWATKFDKVIQVSFNELLALYDPLTSIRYFNIAEFMNRKLETVPR